MNNRPFLTQSIYSGILFIMVFFTACGGESPDNSQSPETINPPGEAFTDTLGSISEPLVTHIFTADPSAHVFEDRLYIYPSHDVDAGIPADDMGSHFDMRDYHVFSMDSVGGGVTDHGVALSLDDVPWAGRQMWVRFRS
ncbi:MAG: hypothetical protein WD035_04915 [Balneolaceae bacterium]